jgi:peptidyl-prolyl cis-trans isomerase A (cyclophilin A)
MPAFRRLPSSCLRPAALLGSLILAAAQVLASGAADAAPQEADPAAEPAPRVVIATELGTIVVEVLPDRAPVTAANFLAYADRGIYDRGSASFYRTVRLDPDNQPGNQVKIEVIQGGLGFEEQPGALPPVAHETTEATGLRHLDGTVSMARDEPGSATSEIFICVGDQPELDFGGRRNPDGQGFAAFGRVVEGMEVVRAIHRRPADGQMLDPPVAIVGVRRVPPPS